MKPSSKNKKQATRFAIIGALNTALDFGILLTLSHLGLPKIASNTISTGITFVISFFANKKYTFQSKNPNIVREIVLFVAVTLFGLWVIQNAIITLLTPFFERFIDNQSIVLLFVKGLATLVSMTWNFVLYKKVVFKG